MNKISVINILEIFVEMINRTIFMRQEFNTWN